MVGSPNYIIGVYDADESTYPAPVERPRRFGGHRGGADQLVRHRSVSRGSTPSSPDARLPGVHPQRRPASGLFTGADDVKTEEEVALWAARPGISSTRATTWRATPSTMSICTRARRKQRPDRLRAVDVRLLDRVRQRRPGQEGARTAHGPARSGRPRGHLPRGRRRTGSRRPSCVASPAHSDGGGPRDRPHLTPSHRGGPLRGQPVTSPTPLMGITGRRDRPYRSSTRNIGLASQPAARQRSDPSAHRRGRVLPARLARRHGGQIPMTQPSIQETSRNCAISCRQSPSGSSSTVSR